MVFYFQTSQPTVEIFQDLFEKESDIFHPLRTSKSLHNHWLLMKQYHLLPDQSGKIYTMYLFCDQKVLIGH